jgi:diguanylate cyclase (GGDEF)-like protein
MIAPSRTAMARPISPGDTPVRPPIIVIGIEQEWAARSLESVLGPRGFAVVRAYSGRQTLDLAEVAAPDVVIVDSRLPDLDGLEVCRMLRDEQRIGLHVPLVLTTSGPAPREFTRTAYTSGAWSVWEQPIDGELLLLRLDNWVRAKRLVDEAERAALVDSGTGLYTYQGLRRRVREVVADAARRATPVACVAIGVSGESDRGEVVGRAASGEAGVPGTVSAELARAIAASTRASDVVGRLGSGDFAIVASATDRAGVEAFVERIRHDLADLPVLVQGVRPRVHLRAGVATLESKAVSAPESETLLMRAATALRYAQALRDTGVRRFEDVPATFV